MYVITIYSSPDLRYVYILFENGHRTKQHKHREGEKKEKKREEVIDRV
jgi:hypothetical protein